VDYFLHDFYKIKYLVQEYRNDNLPNEGFIEWYLKRKWNKSLLSVAFASIFIQYILIKVIFTYPVSVVYFFLFMLLLGFLLTIFGIINQVKKYMQKD
jgi:hypothetical protein